MGKSRRGQAVAVPRGFQGAAPAEYLYHGQLDFHLRVGYADHDDGSGVVAGVECLLVGYGVAHGFDGDIHAVAAGEFAYRFYGVGLRGVDGVRRAEVLCPLQLAVVDVHADDGVRAGKPRARDCGVAHAAAAGDSDGIAAGYAAGVDRRA